jgi:hypothetical protein
VLGVSEGSNVRVFGRLKFLFPAVSFLELIDNFNYKEAIKKCNELMLLCDVLIVDAKIKIIVETIKKLLEQTKRIHELLSELSKIENNKSASAIDYEIIKEIFLLLIADIYENALRRFKTGDYAGCVLRCYRAIEASCQYCEYLNGILPYDDKWKEKLPEAIKHNLEKMRTLAENSKITMEGKLRFMSGLVFVFGGVKGQGTFPEDFKQKIDSIQQKRNGSFLEHGFQIIDNESAESVLQDTPYCISKIIDIPVEVFKNICEKISHDWENK